MRGDTEEKEEGGYEDDLEEGEEEEKENVFDYKMSGTVSTKKKEPEFKH